MLILIIKKLSTSLLIYQHFYHQIIHKEALI